MTKSRKTLSKAALASTGEPRRTLRYGGGIGGSNDQDTDLVAVREEKEDVYGGQDQTLQGVVTTVSPLSFYFLFKH